MISVLLPAAEVSWVGRYSISLDRAGSDGASPSPPRRRRFFHYQKHPHHLPVQLHQIEQNQPDGQGYFWSPPFF